MFQQLMIFTRAAGVAADRWRRVLSAAVMLSTMAGLPAVRPARADEPPASGRSSDASQQKSREAWLKSDAWRKTMLGLNEWFSVQSIYDQDQAAEVKQQLQQRWEQMSVDELEDFQQDLDAKLQMVLSPDGRRILGWVKANLEAASPAYRKTLDLQTPDVLKLTAAQLRDQLDALEQRRSATRSETTAIEHARQARISALQAEQRRQEQERERALDRAAASLGAPGYRGQYFPGSKVRTYPDVLNRGYFFGYGFGFW